MPSISEVGIAVDVATFVFYGLLIALAVYVLYKVYKLIMSLGLGLFDGAKAVVIDGYKLVTGGYELFTHPGVQLDEMFTTRTADGSVAPQDIKPKSFDPIDWIFVPQSVRENLNA